MLLARFRLFWICLQGGRIEFDVVNMAKEKIAVPLSTIIHKATKQNKRIEYQKIVIETEQGEKFLVDISASPMKLSSEPRGTFC